MDNIYEWVYNHFYLPRMKEILRSYEADCPYTEKAKQTLLEACGSALDREDALNTYRDAVGITSFAAGMYFAYHLTTDMTFPDR